MSSNKMVEKNVRAGEESSLDYSGARTDQPYHMVSIAFSHAMWASLVTPTRSSLGTYVDETIRSVTHT